MNLPTGFNLPDRIDTSRPVVELENVSVRYRLPHERIPSLKEYAIRSLSKRIEFHEFWALRHLNLKVLRGEVLGIIGPNGAGKSTLLKVIARVLRPTEGRLVVRGRVAPLLELGAGFDPELTGRENVFLNGAILGYSEADIRARFDRMVEFAGLKEFIDAPLRTYSTGMIARLGFSVATDVQPEILILDEILGVGDVEFQKRSGDRISSFCNSGSTVLLVSHSLEAVQRLCDRAAWLDHGKLRAIGPASEVARIYQDTAIQPFRLDGLFEQWPNREAFEQARLSGEVFGEYYYEFCCGEPYHRTPVWMRFFNSVAENIVARIGPRRVLDAGCGKGFLVEALREREVEAYGMDISQHAIERVYEPVKPYCWAGSLTQSEALAPGDGAGAKYDLIVCIEVLQNLRHEEVELAVANMCAASDDILLSVNPADHRVPTYVNVQPLEYWQALFAKHGFYPDPLFQAGFITPWAMRLRRSLRSA